MTRTTSLRRSRAWLRALDDVRLDLLALLWPCACLICGTPDRNLCRDCRAELRTAEGRYTRVHTAAGVDVCVAGPYRGPLRALLVAFKHGGDTSLGPALGAQLRASLRAALSAAHSPMPLLVAVPSRPARVRERGYRHVEVLIRAATRSMIREARVFRGAGPGRDVGGVPGRGVADAPGCGVGGAPLRCVDGAPLHGVSGTPGGGVGGSHRAGSADEGSWHADPRPILIAGALRAPPDRTAQVGLTAVERERNAAKVRVPWHMRGRLRGREVVLIDDVVTTGATLRGAARALAAVGAEVIGMVAVCATERRRHLRSREPGHRELMSSGEETPGSL